MTESKTTRVFSPVYTLHHFEDDEYRVAINGVEIGGTVTQENGKIIINYFNDLNSLDSINSAEDSIPYPVIQWLRESRDALIQIDNTAYFYELGVESSKF